jgi:hypothetical protein
MDAASGGVAMGTRIMMRTIAAAALAAGLQAAAPAHGQDHAPREALATLAGTWASPTPEPWYGGWGTRRFTFAEGRWELDFRHALDAGMTQPTFRFRTHGAYRVGAPSAVPGAFEAVFGEERKLVTLLTDDPQLVRALGFDACGLTPQVEHDVSVGGCAGWKPVAVCGEDHDLLALDVRGLHFGVRPRDNDMCTSDRRPTALLPHPVVRQ